MRIQTDQPREQLVTAHADEWADLLERDDVPVRLERADPCASVGIVAVDERAVDVQQDDVQRVARRM